MNIGWFDTQNLDNVYCGADGGSYIRIPFLRELNRRGHQIDYQRYHIENYDYTEEPLERLGIVEEAYRFRDSVSCVRLVDRLTDEIKKYDVLFVEARSSQFDEFEQQCEIVDEAIEHDVPVTMLDRNNWAREAPKEHRSWCWLLRPYKRVNGTFKKEEHFPYWYTMDVPYCELEPKYDLVYVGNRWGRTDEMRAFLEELSGYSLMIAGNWPEREPELCDEFSDVEWLGPTPHFATIPLLSLGKATFHVGKPDYNELGFITMRTAEAEMAFRACFYSTDLNHDGIRDEQTFKRPSDIDLDPVVLDRVRYQHLTEPVERAVSKYEEICSWT